MTLEERNKLVNEIQTRSTKITNEAQKMMDRWDDENDETFYYKEINEIYKYSEEIKDIVTKYADKDLGKFMFKKAMKGDEINE